MNKHRTVIFGTSGMLGSRVAYELSQHGDFKVYGVARSELKTGAAIELIVVDSLVNFRDIEYLIGEIKPDYIINCVGWIRQKDAKLSEGVFINSVFPHLLAELGKSVNAKVIHFSTDCVFDGARGSYGESDPPSPHDFYGHSKLLGEPPPESCMCLRTSIVGYELNSQYSLLEWFLKVSRGATPVDGYGRAFFSGLTTNEIGKFLPFALKQFQPGLFNWSGPRISKLDLLRIIRDTFGLTTTIRVCDSPVVDRSLDGARFDRSFSYPSKSWTAMLNELRLDGRLLWTRT